MAYIDPSGMFGGERMALLSDSAKMAWPWFWCASNTVGRIELNYRAFCDGPFRQFRKPPTEKQFWEWVTEFHEANLMFAYEYNGKAWGQWDVTEKYLPKYKTKADEKPPAPMTRPFMDWQKRYLERKQEALSGKCPVLNISRNLPQVLKVEENSPVSIGVVVGVDLGLDKTLCAADAAPEQANPELFPVKPDKTVPAKAWFDAEHQKFYKTYWRRVGPQDSRRAHEKLVRALVAEGMGYQEAADFLVLQAIRDRERFEHGPDWDWRQNLHPATWLNGRRYQDESQPRASPGLGHKTKQQQNADMWDEA